MSRSDHKYRFVSSPFSDSLWLGTRNRFNDQLDSTTARYTYFVPRDKAWRSLENEFPSVFKKLFMQEFAYHVSSFLTLFPLRGMTFSFFHHQANSILERHLIVSDRVFTMNDLRNMSAGSDLILNTVRDQLKIRIMEHDKRKFAPFFRCFWHRILFRFYPFPDLHFQLKHVTQSLHFQHTKLII